jgi:hypothetical protein
MEESGIIGCSSGYDPEHLSLASRPAVVGNG